MSTPHHESKSFEGYSREQLVKMARSRLKANHERLEEYRSWIQRYNNSMVVGPVPVGSKSVPKEYTERLCTALLAHQEEAIASFKREQGKEIEAEALRNVIRQAEETTVASIVDINEATTLREALQLAMEELPVHDDNSAMRQQAVEGLERVKRKIESFVQRPRGMYCLPCRL